jgi:hypothetical protein
MFEGACPFKHEEHTLLVTFAIKENERFIPFLLGLQT